ncbi:MAG: hypothetical protein KAS17_10875 [Victivallaceae bacterium]|nr:hypothetical protein [Victivallaceae bacterium]
MATILTDKDIKKLFGNVIIDGDDICIRPNSYILRIGKEGEFINTSKKFNIDNGKKKGIKIMPGHSAGITAFETLDFRRKTVDKIFPGSDLHGLLTPTTDLSREGIIAATTQVDAGYHGTINWTLANSSSEERKFLFKEKVYRLTIFRLDEGENPEFIYNGDYQAKTGYVGSQRRVAPVSMKANEWEDALVGDDPSSLLDALISSGYPWNTLGKQLKFIDEELASVTNEYSKIYDSINKMEREIDNLTKAGSNIESTIKQVVKDEASVLQNRWLIGAASLITAPIGLALAITSNEVVFTWFKTYGVIIGIVAIMLSIAGITYVSKNK